MIPIESFVQIVKTEKYTRYPVVLEDENPFIISYPLMLHILLNYSNVCDNIVFSIFRDTVEKLITEHIDPIF